MIFRQIFDIDSSTYTYLIASRYGGEALIIDPVHDKVEQYLSLLKELDLKLVKAIDTHFHADHITGLASLRDHTKCITIMGKQSDVDVVAVRVTDGDRVDIEGVNLDVIHTPGHTEDSYSFYTGDRVFTGDTLLIRGTGRTDFQKGDPKAQYSSLFEKLLKLPEETLVYPAHDYNGNTVSTIAEEKNFNPRLQVTSADEYCEIMNNLNLANPKMMDIALPANLKVGINQGVLTANGMGIAYNDIESSIYNNEFIFVDLRDERERVKRSVIPGSVHVPYGNLENDLKVGGQVYQLSKNLKKKIIFYCAFGERSSIAVMEARSVGINSSFHITGGVNEWKKLGGPIE